VKEKLKVGVIGVGHLGGFHAQKYAAIPAVDLVGVADTDEDRVTKIAKLHDTRPYRDYSSLLQNVDAVSLAVPTEQHFEIAKDILSEGVHLLIEKPITYALEPADTLIRIAGEKGVVLQVGLVERFKPAVVKMKSMLKDPFLIESHRMNIYTQRGTDVDVVLDLMIHDLDIMLDVIPFEVRELHAVGMSVVTEKTDIANVRMIFENGTVANLSASRVSDNNLRKIRVFQSDAYISVNCLKNEISVTRLDGETKDLTNIPKVSTEKTRFPGSDALADEISSFVNAVMNRTEPVVSGRDGRRALKYVLTIIDQIERGCGKFEAAP
jgi:predicted dehydrogenase